jgi:asparagine synthetase B (glutamine-hydrolysing)
MKFCEVCGTFVIANQRLNNNNLLGRVTLWRSISPPSIPQEMQINKEKRSQYEEAIQRRRDALVQHKKAIARIKLSHLSQHEQTTTDPNKRLLLRLSRMDSIARSAFASIV